MDLIETAKNQIGEALATIASTEPACVRQQDGDLDQVFNLLMQAYKLLEARK